MVKEAGKVFCEFHLTKKKKADWDIAWYDRPPGFEFLKSMHFHQRVNHFPGMFYIAKKNMLGRRLNQMARLIPTEYNFFPKTYMMPHDFKDFTEYISKQKQKNARTFIVKPEDECQGRGIFLTRDPSIIKPDDQIVV